MRRCVAVITDAKFLPLCHAVDLLAQRRVVAIVEIQAVNAVSAVRIDMRITLHQAAEPRAQLIVIDVGNFVFVLVPIVVLILHICVSPPRCSYRIQFLPKTNLNVMCLLHEKKTSEEVFFAYLISLRSITSDTSADTESAVSEKTQSAKNGII